MMMGLVGALALFGCDDDGVGAGGDAGSMGGAGGVGAMGGEGGMGGGAGGEGGMVVVPDGLSIPDLDGEVTVRFDSDGVLHVDCASDADCFAAQGYYHASQRFIQMDIRRRFVRGTLSEMVGDATLATDKINRFLISGRSGERVEQRMWDSATPRTRAAIEAYTRGVNAWLYDYRNERNGAVLNDEYEFPLINKDAITDWTPLDSAACILALIQQLTDHSDSEMFYGEIFAQLDPDTAMDLYGLAPSSAATVLPTSKRGGTAFEPWQLDLIHHRMVQARSLFAQLPFTRPHSLEPADTGSNNWVVGPSRSADGRALLGNDPHLAMSNPSIWYLVNLDAKTKGEGELHVAGASFAGLPGVILGQNENIAWGATTTFFDMADVYIETLSEDGEGVMFNGEKVPFVQQDHVFKVSNAEDVVEPRLYVPHHGPVVAIDRDAGTAMSVKWTGQNASTDLNFILDMNHATNVDEAKAVVENTVTTVGQNFVFIDRAGGFGWYPYNNIPNRPWASADLPSWLPLPGDGSAEWDGFLAPSDIPQAQNPDTGYVATANNDMTGALYDGDPTNDGLPMLQHFTATGYRQQRILERIEAEPMHTLESMQSIQADVRSSLGEMTVPAILAAVDVDGIMLSAEAQLVRDALAAWDFECPTGLATTDAEGAKSDEGVASSIGCAAFHVLWRRLRGAAFADDVLADMPSAPKASALVRLLTQPERLIKGAEYWDDVSTDDTVETAQTQVVSALESTHAWLTENVGADVDDWRWGRIHTLTLRADLFDAAGLPTYNNPAEGAGYANDGGLFTVDVANPRNLGADDYSHSAGPSMRFACAAGEDGVECTIELPGGQRHFRDSPNYDDFLQKYLVNTPTPLLFNLEDVEAAGPEVVTIAPR
jgi:penicillin amidase